MLIAQVVLYSEMTSKIFILSTGIDMESFSRLKRFFRLCQMNSNDDKEKI